MDVNRREFLKGLVAAAAVVAVPTPARAPAPSPGNTLIPPELIAREALDALRRNVLMTKFLNFQHRYDIEHDALMYTANYHVPAHFEDPVASVEGVPLGDPRDDPTFTVERKFVDEVHYVLEVPLERDWQAKLPEIEEELQAMMKARIEEALAA